MKNKLKSKMYNKFKDLGWLDHSEKLDFETAMTDILTFGMIPFSIFVLMMIMVFK